MDDPFEEPLDMSWEGILARAVSSYAFAHGLAEWRDAVDISWFSQKSLSREDVVNIVIASFEEGFGAGFRAGFGSCGADPGGAVPPA